VDLWAWGYGLIEGPRAAPDGSLYFSDVHKGGVYRRRPDGEIEVAVPKRRGVGGIALHADGGLVVSGRNVCHARDGVNRILYERDDVGGFNDLFTDVAGRVYVGSLRDDPFTLNPDRQAGHAYRIDAPGEAVTLYGGVGLTNGIGFSPDGRRIYHVDSAASAILVHDVDAAGEVAADGDVFAHVDRGAPDGLAVDTDGGVWVAVYGGGGCVTRFTPDGTFDRSIAVPAVSVTSLCFYGEDLADLVVVTADNTEQPDYGGSIFHIDAGDVGVRGVPAPPVRI
jgi:sugar lactone lactonase YvrE